MRNEHDQLRGGHRGVSCVHATRDAFGGHGIHEPHRRYMGTWPKVRPKRVRVITMDVTGTLLSFRGTLEEHYLGAAEKCG
jgi:hypothetical protein